MHVVLVLVLIVALGFSLAGFVADHWVASSALLAAGVGALGVRWILGRQTRLETMRAAHEAQATKLARLSAQHDAATVDRLTRGVIAKGDTREMVREARGEPAVQDERTVGTKREVIWKYGQRGAGRFAGRVIFEDGRVERWVD
jgi:hypothetical protein